MKILFARHAETQVNLNRLTHKTKDPAPLTQLGVKQARMLAKLCKNEKVEKIFSSPEKRATQTAKIIASKLNIEHEILSDFAERNIGEWSGKAWSEIEKVLNQMSIEERYTFIPIGGESWQAMEKRLKQALQSVTNCGLQVVAVVTHEGALRGLMPILLNTQKESSLGYHFDNASVTSFRYKSGIFKEIKINDTSHLKII